MFLVQTSCGYNNKWIQKIMTKFYDFIGRKSELTDVFYAARIPKSVKGIINSRDEKFFYVVPWKGKTSDLIALWFLFLRNGVFLTPHKSKHYESYVLRCPNKNQQFMRDVCEINRNPNMYKEWLRQYHESHK